MNDKPAAGAVLKQAAEDKFKLKEADFPARDGSLAFELERNQDKWHFEQISAINGGIETIWRYHICDGTRPSSIERYTIMNMIASFMVQVENTDSEVAFKEMLAVAAAHPLIGGLSLEVNGEERPLCGALKDEEIEARATEILDIRDEQRLLKDLDILDYNEDKRTRFLIVDTPVDRAEFVRRYQLSLVEEMDLIVEVKVKKELGTGRITFQEPIGVFQLSKTPRFDYASRTLTGVTDYKPLNEYHASHDDIWGAAAIMNRLPREDITHEDARVHIGRALDKLQDDSPEPS
jgi:hypothetical protein